MSAGTAPLAGGAAAGTDRVSGRRRAVVDKDLLPDLSLKLLMLEILCGANSASAWCWNTNPVLRCERVSERAPLLAKMYTPQIKFCSVHTSYFCCNNQDSRFCFRQISHLQRKRRVCLPVFFSLCWPVNASSDRHGAFGCLLAPGQRGGVTLLLWESSVGS